jgi:hypothetical protein
MACRGTALLFYIPYIDMKAFCRCVIKLNRHWIATTKNVTSRVDFLVVPFVSLPVYAIFIKSRVYWMAFMGVSWCNVRSSEIWGTVMILLIQQLMDFVLKENERMKTLRMYGDIIWGNLTLILSL